MRNLYCLMILFCLVKSAYAQQGFPKYYRYLAMVGKADSLFKSGDSLAAAAAYAKAISLPLEKGVELPMDRLNFRAGEYWALAKNADSAFRYLNAAIKLGFVDVDAFGKSTGLAPIKNDARWNQLLQGLMEKKKDIELLEMVYRERTNFVGSPDEILFYPPTPELRKFLLDEKKPLVSLNYKNFRIHLRGNSYAAAHLEELKAALSLAMQRSLQVLGVQRHQRGTHVIIVDDKHEMGELTGFSVSGGLALPASDLLFLVWNGGRRIQASHELFHVISNQVWGVSHSRLLNEGAAVFADNTCYIADPIYPINAVLSKKGKFLSIEKLVEDFDAVAQKAEVQAYLQSAGIFKYLYETYGIQKMKQLWTGGFGQFEKIYNFPISQLQSQLSEKLGQVQLPVELDLNKLLEEGCG